jgi:Zn-dependent hydrolases, including glyoxylases
MTVKSIPAGYIGANCYYLYDEATLEAAIVDPGDDGERLVAAAQSLGLKVRYILLTHGHFDHTGAVNAFRTAYPEAAVYIHKADAGEKAAQMHFQAFDGLNYYDEGDKLPFCGGEIAVYSTPGHSKGSVCLQFGNDLFSGDTLFAGSMGRTDFAGGDLRTMSASLVRLSAFPEETKVWPGHESSTTIGQEKRRNMYMLQAMRGGL